MKPPRGPGHDFSGTIQELRAGVKKFKEGDQVAVKPSLPCYGCEACEAGFFEAFETAQEKAEGTIKVAVFA